MADDFDPQVSTKQIPEETGNRIDVVAYPDDGAHVACVLIASSSNKAAIRIKLQEIAALADTCEVKVWTASSEAGKRARCSVTGRVSKNAEPEA